MKKFIVVLVFAYTIALSSCAWAITANMSITGSPGSGKVGKSYSASFGVMFSTSALLNWSMTGSVPGLSFSGFGASATLSGTPTRAGSYFITVKVSSNSGSASKSFTITIAEGSGGGNNNDPNNPQPSASGVAVNSTNFPDVAFRSYVSDNIDTDRNGYLSDSEISSTERIFLDYGYNGVTSLEGIEYFTALTIRQLSD